MKTSSRKPISARRAYGGFTLVELLLVVAIIAVLATLSVSVLGSAQNDARVSATRARVSLIQRVLEAELEDYEVRRVPFGGAIAGLVTDLAPEPPLPTGPWAAGIRNVHVKNLKRMVVADLIRAEMPNGRSNVPTTGAPPIGPPEESLAKFPSDSFRAYVTNLGIDTNTNPSYLFIKNYRFSGGITRWANWNFDPNVPNTVDSVNARSAEQRLADSSELLYAILNQIDFDGSSALDSLGSNAIGDSDGDGQLEIIDAWGEPIVFQFHQVNLERQNPGPVSDGVWAVLDPNLLTEFEVDTRLAADGSFDAASFAAAEISAAKPVRVDQIRPFVTSERLLEIDQQPVDFDTL